MSRYCLARWRGRVKQLTRFHAGPIPPNTILAGEKFDPESTLPVPAGSYVVHYANKVHYDGAKGEECVIQVSGMGPATSTPAEKK